MTKDNHMPRTPLRDRPATPMPNVDPYLGLTQATVALEHLRGRIEDGDDVSLGELQEAEAAERFARLRVDAEDRRRAAAQEVARATLEAAARERLAALEVQADRVLQALAVEAQPLVGRVQEVYALQAEIQQAVSELNNAILPRGAGNAAPVDWPVVRRMPAPGATVLTTIAQKLPRGLGHPRSMALSYLISSAENGGV